MVLGGAMIVLVAGALAFAFSQSRVFAVQAIPLEWRPRLDQGKMELEISRSIEADIGVRLSNVLGKRPWEINLEALSSSIRSLSWIADARLQRVFPDRLVVSITPKRPLAVVLPKGAGLRPITEDGELMEEWTAPVVPDVPFLRGDLFLKNPEIRSKAVQLIKALPESGVLDRSNIAEIVWNNGFSLVLLSPRTEIILGETQIEKKTGPGRARAQLFVESGQAGPNS
jgi:cell division septal protein FtsQ